MRQQPGPTTFQWPRQCRQCGVPIKVADGDLCGPCADVRFAEANAALPRPSQASTDTQAASHSLRQHVARELVIVLEDINYYTAIQQELHRTRDQCLKEAAALQAYLDATPEDEPA